jgi:peptidoglycan/LPS O-acetylase OafA/YrhL
LDNRSTGARVSAFDGLRGLAVAGVLLFHAGFGWAGGAFLGVSALFTLSGFLITSILLDEHARAGRISLKSFWARRARRLLPAAYVALAGILVYGATVATTGQLRNLRVDVLAAFAYVANWRFYFAGQSYESLFSTPSPVLHFWSLAIEEQFYIVFPLVLMGAIALTRARRSLLFGLFALAAAASFGLSLVLASISGHSRVYFGTDTRAAELLIGALLAIALHARPLPVPTPRVRAVAMTGAVVTLGTMFVLWSTAERTDAWLYKGGFVAHAMLTAMLIAAARVDTPISRALGWKPLATLGLLSYAIYLFHWPIYLWLSPERTGLAAAPLFALRIGVTLVLAVVSFRLLEQPVLQKRRFRGTKPRLVVPLTAIVLLGAMVVVTASPPAPEVVFSALGDGDFTASAPAAVISAPWVAPSTAKKAVRNRALHRPLGAKRPLRILIVGDSVGLTLGRGFEIYARAHPDQVAVRNRARKYCPIGRELPAIMGIGEPTSTHACNWTTAWSQAIDGFDPDVTVLLSTIWEAVPRQLPGQSTLVTPGNAALDSWQVGEYKAAATMLTARGGHVLWLNAPCRADRAIEKPNELWYVNRRNIPTAAAARSKLVHPIDLDAEICPGGHFSPDYRSVKGARPDGSHFSDAGAVAVAQWLLPMMPGRTKPPAYRKES